MRAAASEAAVNHNPGPKSRTVITGGERMITVSEGEMDADMGVCIECGHRQYGVEPDAYEYKCEGCGRLSVYGLDEAVLQGLVYIRGGQE